ncbi:KilA-N domain-containing protein [Candidatus Halobeggiatoa sp. HSG11]|nr:KilA-N domain-containing protein [Candidatus Halobeggiatoa sp. HSG11]
MTNQMMISRNFNGAVIRQRPSDGYLDATAMCKINGKRWFDYYRTKETQSFLIALSKSTGLPIESQNGNSRFGENKGLVEIIRGGNNAGTWIHSKVAIYLAIWCSPEFAVLVTDWIYELLTKGSVSLKPEPTQEIAEYVKINADILEGFGITGTAKQNALNNSIKDKFGYDVIKNLNTKAQQTELQQSESLLLIPSDIAKRTGLRSARQVNLKLIELKLQTPYRDSKKRLHYKLTDKGQKYGTYQDKSYNSSRPVRSIKWYENVLELF